MKYDSISGLFTAIADEIRAKEGSSELINPQDLPERVKNLSGVPNVPTVECWKITLSSLTEEGMKEECISTIKYAFSGFSYSVACYGKAIIFSGTESDGAIYGGMGPEIVYGSSYQELASDVFYILIMNVGNDYYLEDHFSYFKEMLNACGEQISLSDFLSIAAQAQNYEDRDGYA